MIFRGAHYQSNPVLEDLIWDGFSIPLSLVKAFFCLVGHRTQIKPDPHGLNWTGYAHPWLCILWITLEVNLKTSISVTCNPSSFLPNCRVVNWNLLACQCVVTASLYMESCQSDQLRLLSKHRKSLNGIIVHNLLPRPAILPSRPTLQQSVFLCECVHSEFTVQGLITWPCNCFKVSFWQLWPVQGSLQGCNSHLPYICYRVLLARYLLITCF